MDEARVGKKLEQKMRRDAKAFHSNTRLAPPFFALLSSPSLASTSISSPSAWNVW